MPKIYNLFHSIVAKNKYITAYAIQNIHQYTLVYYESTLICEIL